MVKRRSRWRLVPKMVVMSKLVAVLKLYVNELTHSFNFLIQFYFEIIRTSIKQSSAYSYIDIDIISYKNLTRLDLTIADLYVIQMFKLTTRGQHT